MPLAFHVDYWDNLGWPDRFAQALFTKRQRTIAWRHGTRTIYTPQVVVQGKDWRDWRALEARAAEIHTTPARATLNVEVTQTSAAQIEVIAQAEVPEATERPQAQMFVALYENNLHSKVTAGENQGKTLHHDFVIRHWFGPVDVDDQGMARLQHTLALSSAWKRADLGLVLFVQNHQNGTVLQVLGLALGDQ